MDLPDLRVARVLADPLALLVLAGQPAPLAMRQLLQAQPAPPALLVQSQRLPVLLGLLDLKVLAAPQALLVARVFLAQQDRRALQALAALRDQLELPARLVPPLLLAALIRRFNIIALALWPGLQI